MNVLPPSDADIQTLSDNPGSVPAGSVSAGSFEIGLASGGTIASGACTA